MARSKHPYQWLGPLSFSLLILIAPFLIAYIGYTESREGRFLSSRFAYMASAASRVEARMNNVFTVVRNSFATSTKEKKECESGCEDGDPLIRSRSVLEQNSLGLEARKLKMIVGTDSDVPSQPQGLFRQDQSRVVFEVDGFSIPAITSILIGELDPGNRLDDILLFDASGATVYQKHPQRGRISQFADLEQPGNSQDDDGRQELLTDTLSTMVRYFQQVEYLVFEAPVRIGTQPKAEIWKLVGLVSKKKLISDKLKFPTAELVGFILLLTLLILSWPFLRIRYLGPYDIVYRHDLWIQVASGCIAVALITVVLLQVKYSNHFFSRLDMESRRIGIELTDAFIQELENQVLTLHESKDDLICAYVSDVKEGSCEFSRENDRLKPDLLSSHAGKYRSPLLKMLYLMDEDGQQQVKWSTSSVVTRPGNFVDRLYFQRALPKNQGSLYKIQGKGKRSGGATRDEDSEQEDQEEAPGFFVDVIESRTTGEQSVVISMPADCTKKGGPESPCVIVMSSDIWSMKSAVPFGFGYALVDKTGKVLFTSSQDSGQQLRFFDEIDEPAELMVALDVGHGEITTEYHGSEHRFDIQPVGIEGPDWMLITYYNKDLYELFLLETAGAAAVAWGFWFGIFALLAACYVLASYAVGRERMVSWQNRTTLSHLIILQVVMLAILFSIIAFAGEAPGKWRVGLGIFLIFAVLYMMALSVSLRQDRITLRHLATNQFVALVILILIAAYFLEKVVLLASSLYIPFMLLCIRQMSRNLWELSFLRTGVRHACIVIAMLLFMLLMAVLPVLKFYEYASELGFNYIVNAEYMHQNSQRSFQDERLAVWQAGTGAGPADAERALNNWKMLTTLPKSTSPGVESGPVNCSQFRDEPRRGPLFSWFCENTTKLPVYSEEASQIRPAYRIELMSDAVLRKVKEEFYNPNWKKEDRFKEIVMHFDQQSDTAGLVVRMLIMLLLMAMLTIFVWRWAVNLMGLQISNLVKGATLSAPKPSAPTHQIIYGMAERSRGVLLDNIHEDRVFTLDFRAATGKSSVAELLRDASDNHDVVVVDHFDELIKDPALVRLRVELLEFLLHETETSVFVVTSMDILSYLNQRLIVDQDLDSKLVARLAVSLSKFSHHYFDEQSPDKPADDASHARKLLYEECFHPNLQNILHQVEQDPLLDDYTEQQIINLVLTGASSIYQVMWDVCTHLEKFTLIQLAHNRPINPNNWEVAQKLKQRGYLRRDPNYRIFNRSFESFIESVEPIEDMDAWQSEVTSTWDRIKIPVLVLVLFGLAFLAITQPGIFNSLFAWIAAASAALPVALRFFGSWWASRAVSETVAK